MKPLVDAQSCWLVEGRLARRSLSSGRQLAFLIAMVVIASSTLALGQAGQLDSTFGTGGIFTTNFAQYDVTIDSAVAIQSDGKIVLGGTIPTGANQVAALLRLNSDGTLDPSFGTGGIVTSDFGIEDGAAVTAVVIQPNGQILAAAVGDFLVDGSVGRFNSDGSVDTTFGTGGFAISRSIDSVAGGLSLMALQADGKILVTGGNVIGRYTSTGQLDPSFGSGGMAPLASAAATGIALQSDGKILITTGIGGPTQLNAAPLFPQAVAGSLARYSTNGSLDITFGVSGQAACVASAAAIAVQGDGKIVVAGTINSAFVLGGNQTGFGVFRYNSNGTLDTTFNLASGLGNGGGVITGFGSSFPDSGPFALAIQSNGDIVVAGLAGNGNPQGIGLTSSSFALARYLTSGKLDTNFGTNGTVITTLTTGNTSLVSALALQSDGKIIAAGNSGSLAQRGFFLNNFAVARYLAQ